MKWPKDAEQHAYMRMRQEENIAASKNNPNELWMYEKLKSTPYKWKRQRQWGYRLFDFFCAELGVAVEVDGPEHDPDYDAVRDHYNLTKSGIVVLRVRNRNEDDAMRCLEQIRSAETWNERRAKLGLEPINR
jgi:very-short-patch-repair endonuclease